MLVFSNRLPQWDNDLKLLTIVLFLYLVLQAVAIIFNQGDISELKRPTKLLLMLLLVVAIMHRGLKVNYFYIGLAVGMILAVMYASWQYYFLNVARPGIHNNPQLMGWISATSFSLLLVASTELRNWRMFLCLVGMVASIICVILSGSRGALLGLGPVIIFAWWYWGSGIAWKNSVKTKTSIFLMSILALIVVVIILGAFSKRIVLGVDQTISYMEQGNKRSSIGLRLEAWRGAIIAAREHPILGIGTGEMRRQNFIQEKINMGQLDSSIKALRHTHSDYMGALQSKGIPGLLVQLLIYVVPAIVFYRKLRAKNKMIRLSASCGILLVLNFASFSLTDMPLRHSLSLAFYLITLGIFLGVMKHSSKNHG